MPKNYDDEDDEKPRKKARRPADDEDEDNEEEDDTPRQRRRPVAINPLPLVARFVSPVPFLFTIVLFFLPWTDIGCQSKEGTKQLLTQSGFQAAYGSASEGSFAEEFGKLNNAPKNAKPADIFGNDFKKDRGGKDVGRAVLLWPYLVVLVVGLAVPMAIPGLKPRGFVTAGLAALAALLLVVQVVGPGMPLRNAAEEVRKEFGEAKNAGPKPGPMFPQDTATVGSSFLPSFFASAFLLVVIGAYGLAQVVWGSMSSAGHGGKRAGRRRRRRRRPRRSDDEDDG